MSKRLREWRLFRARAARAEKPAAPPNPIEKFAEKAHDLDAIRKSVEDAAAVSAGLWLSYLFVLFYIGIAAGAVTHKDLLLENPVKLPFLNVELPLVAFFVLAPILFIVSHAYTLVHFVMLGAKVGVFDTELRAQLGDAPEMREGLRRQLPSNIFVQFLAGPGDIRKGGLGWLLKTIAGVSLVIGPVLLLLLIQVQFLPYHLEWVTWVQRFAVLADLILLWALWPAVFYGQSEIKWPRLWRHPVLTLASLVSIGLAFTAATFPGERMEDWIGRRQWIWPNGVTAWLGAKDLGGKPKRTSVHDLLFNGEVDEVTRRRKSLFSNTLVLPAFDGLEAAKIDDPKKLDSVKQTLVLRGRHLESAVFNNSDLRKADLGDAYLQGASFYQAKLQGAWFYKAKLQAAVFRQAKLQCASLDNAHLEAAWLDNAELQGAWLNEASFQGASLRDAQLQGAYLMGAQLKGASLRDAQLQGASLTGELTAVFEDGLKQSALSKDDVAALKVTIMKEAPEGENRENALKRIENPNISPEGSAQETLNKEGRSVEDETAHRSALADHLKSLACSGDENSPYIVHGLVANGRIEDTGTQAPSLVAAILKPDCPVSAALTGADKAALKRIAKEASAAH